MPFLSKDWRSPGEEWVRYEGGWERRKTVSSIPGSDVEPTNRLSPSLDLAEVDVSTNPMIPKKILRQQSSKCSNSNGSLVTNFETENTQGKIDDREMNEISDNRKESQVPYAMDVSTFGGDGSRGESCENRISLNGSNVEDSQENIETMKTSTVVAGCRPKVKTKPIIIPKFNSNYAEGHKADITPLRTRYSFSNTTVADRLSSTLPRRVATMSEGTKDQNHIDSTSTEDYSDINEDNDIDDEYEKINNPLRYHLRQHFRMRRRQRSQRSLSVNEPSPSGHEKVQPTHKIECDSNYDVRRSPKEGNSQGNRRSQRRASHNHPQRNSGSPTSNIWLRLVEDEENIGKPFFPITIRNTREVAGFNGLAEALIRLDFTRAIGDVRRFKYVACLMELLFSHDKLSQLPGAAQKILFRMLEVVADSVYSNGRSIVSKRRQNEHVLRRLLEQLHTTMAIYHVWGSPFLGGGHLLKQHSDTRRKITGFVEKMQTEFKQDLAAPGLVERLPEECVREILLRLNDPTDILRAGQSCATMDRIANEKRVWRELVQTHFTKAQTEFILAERPELKDSKDWQALHTALRRRYGIRQDFTEMLMLCRRCCALFWKSIGHPCLIPEHIVEDRAIEKAFSEAAGIPQQNNPKRTKSGEDNQFEPSPEYLVPINPQTFLTFFSV